MEKKYLIAGTVLLIIVAVVAFNFGKMTGQVAKETTKTAEAKKQISAEKIGETQEETAKEPEEQTTT